MSIHAISIISYLIAAILFILALRGLSSPNSARQGNIFGMLGMVIAVVTTFWVGENLIPLLIIVPIVLGGLIGIVAAKKSTNDQNARVSCTNAFVCWVGGGPYCCRSGP